MSDPTQQLRELAVRLHAEGADPLDICYAVLRLNIQLGRPVRVAADMVRRLPGLETFNCVDAWQVRWADPAFQKSMMERWYASEHYQNQARLAAERSALPSAEDRRRSARIGKVADLLRGRVEDICDLVRPLVREEVREVLAEDLPDALDALQTRGGGRAE